LKQNTHASVRRCMNSVVHYLLFPLFFFNDLLSYPSSLPTDHFGFGYYLSPSAGCSTDYITLDIFWDSIHVFKSLKLCSYNTIHVDQPTYQYSAPTSPTALLLCTPCPHPTPHSKPGKVIRWNLAEQLPRCLPNGMRGIRIGLLLILIISFTGLPSPSARNLA
jgi:hypothetical protein